MMRFSGVRPIFFFFMFQFFISCGKKTDGIFLSIYALLECAVFCLCTRCFYSSRLSTTTTRILIRYAIYSQIGPPLRVDCLARYGSIGVKCLFQGHNDALFRSGTEPRSDNLAVANLRTYPLHRS